MIKDVEVNDVTFTVDFEAFPEEPETWDEPGCGKYMEFNSVVIVVDETVINIWSLLSDDTLEEIEKKLWEMIEN